MAILLIEIELEITGTYDHGEPDVGIGAGYENIQIERVELIQRSHARIELLKELGEPTATTLKNALLEYIDNDTMQQALADEDS